MFQLMLAQRIRSNTAQLVRRPILRTQKPPHTTHHTSNLTYLLPTYLSHHSLPFVFSTSGFIVVYLIYLSIARRTSSVLMRACITNSTLFSFFQICQGTALIVKQAAKPSTQHPASRFLTHQPPLIRVYGSSSLPLPSFSHQNFTIPYSSAE